MNDATAHITSIDAIRQLRLALLKFDEESKHAITSLSLEVRRAVEWVEVDRMQYWPAQLRKSQQQLIQARNDLERCELKYGSEDAPPCYEQKQALLRAKRRVRLCEDKIRSTKRWAVTVRHEVNEFEGQLAKFSNALDTDLPRAAAALERMTAALEKYIEARQPDPPKASGKSETADPEATGGKES